MRYDAIQTNLCLPKSKKDLPQFKLQQMILPYVDHFGASIFFQFPRIFSSFRTDLLNFGISSFAKNRHSLQFSQKVQENPPTISPHTKKIAQFRLKDVAKDMGKNGILGKQLCYLPSPRSFIVSPQISNNLCYFSFHFTYDLIFKLCRSVYESLSFAFTCHRLRSIQLFIFYFIFLFWKVKDTKRELYVFAKVCCYFVYSNILPGYRR